MPTLKPYPFEQLKKYTEKEAVLISRLARFIPSDDSHGEGLGKIAAALKKYLGSSPAIKLESLFETTFRQFVAGLPDRFICAVVSLTPKTGKAMIEIDPDLTHVLIDKLLGGSGEMPKANHPITPLEEGVIQFLIVKILSLWTEFYPSSSLRCRLDQIFSKSAPLSLMEEEVSPVVLLTFRIRIDKADVYFRLCLPVGLLSEMIPAGGDVMGEGDPYFEKRMKNFEHFKTVLWGEAGRVNLPVSDLEGLERGDIILFDESWPTLENGTLSGNLILRVGEGGEAGIDGLIEQDGEVMKVRVERIWTNQ